MEHDPSSSYPTHALDNTYIKTCTLFIGLAVQGRLSTSILHEKAFRLISKWPELGGHLDTSTTPPTIHPDPTGSHLDFKSRRLDGTRLADSGIPLGYHNHPGVNEGKPEYHNVETRKMEDLFHFDAMDWTGLGRPPTGILGLRVTVLDDATLLGFRLPHSFSDAEGAYEILSAFASSVGGNENIPNTRIRPPKVSAELASLPVDSVDPVPKSDDEGFVQHSANDFRVGVTGFLNYIVRGLVCGISEAVFARKQPRHKMIRLPAAYVTELKRSVQEFSEMNEFAVSTGDVISAWLLKNMSAKLEPSNEPMHLFYCYNIRQYLFPQDQQSTERQVTLHNCYYDLCLRFPPRSAFQQMSLAQIATHIRKHLITNRSLDDVKERVAFFENNAIVMPLPMDKPITAYDPTPIFSSWAKFGLWDLDFGGALEGGNGDQEGVQRESGMKTGGGKVLAVLPTLERPLGDRPRRFAFILQDDNGDFWVDIKLSREEWEGFEGAVF